MKDFGSSMQNGPQGILSIIRQHAEEAASVHAARTALTRAPHIRCVDLRRFDDRLAAHLDGLAVAGGEGWAVCEAALGMLSPSVLFTAAVRALIEKHEQRLDRLFAVTQAASLTSGLVSAFGWCEPEQLQGVVASLLAAQDPFRRMVGIAACGVHRVDPGLASPLRFQDAVPTVRARAIRTAGELGKCQSLEFVHRALDDEDTACRFWAAWSSVLLGSLTPALDVLAGFARQPGLFRSRALLVALRSMDINTAHASLRFIAQDPKDIRALVQGVGVAGDPQYVPWLIRQMDTPELSRLAGESFTMITGIALTDLNADRRPLEGAELGPTDAPEDDNVEMSSDEDLPWPDSPKVKAWWEDNKHRFQVGVRYFVGAPPTRDHCIGVLRTGYQRQRVAAAHYLCLLNPGSPLFNTSAPAWRQQRWLAKLV